MTTPISSGHESRINKLVSLLANGQVVFGSFSGSHDATGAAQTIRNRDLDFVFYSMEALEDYNIPNLQAFMQFMNLAGVLENRYDIRTKYPMLVRIPPLEDDREIGPHRVAEVLDSGAHGIVFPQLNSPEDAKLAIDSMRYAGLRPEREAESVPAASYWGLSEGEYKQRADVWPINPEGELINMFLIENQDGIRHARQIVNTPGVSIAVPGPGDLNRAYKGDREAVENAIQTVLAACKEFDIPCGITANVNDVERRLSEGFRVIIADAETNRIGMKTAGRTSN